MPSGDDHPKSGNRHGDGADCGDTLAIATRPADARAYLQAEQEGVVGSVERVVARRLDYVTRLLAEFGLDRTEARRRAALALTVTVGMHQLHIAARATMSRPGKRR